MPVLLTDAALSPRTPRPAGAILGVGMDLVETPRLARALAGHGERFERRVFTPEELAECAARPDRLEALAARFAAKAACLKAFGTGRADGMGFSQVGVVERSGRRPALRLSGKAAERAREIGVTRIHLSLTNLEALAGAVVVLEG